MNNKLMSEIYNFPCKCGHEADDHSGLYCYACFTDLGYYKTGTVPDFSLHRGNHFYSPDTLKYIEKLYDSRQ